MCSNASDGCEDSIANCEICSVNVCSKHAMDMNISIDASFINTSYSDYVSGNEDNNICYSNGKNYCCPKCVINYFDYSYHESEYVEDIIDMWKAWDSCATETSLHERNKNVYEKHIVRLKDRITKLENEIMELHRSKTADELASISELRKGNKTLRETNQKLESAIREIKNTIYKTLGY